MYLSQGDTRWYCRPEAAAEGIDHRTTQSATPGRAGVAISDSERQFWQQGGQVPPAFCSSAWTPGARLRRDALIAYNSVRVTVNPARDRPPTEFTSRNGKVLSRPFAPAHDQNTIGTTQPADNLDQYADGLPLLGQSADYALLYLRQTKQKLLAIQKQAAQFTYKSVAFPM